MDSFEEVRQDVLAILRQHGLTPTTGALVPLQKLDFEKLVDIHDHEAGFLRDQFVRGLLEAHEARSGDGRGTSKVSATDVRHALVMLGGALRVASDEQLSEQSKSRLKAICPYCKQRGRS